MRSLVLLVVVGFAFSLVVPTVRSFLAQRADVMALERDVEAARQRSTELDAELARWDDPAFVAAQARERLAFVLPGEVAYRVVDPHVVEVTAADEGPVEPETPTSGILTPSADRPWFESIWESIQVAGETDPADDGAPDRPAGTSEGTADDDGPDGPDGTASGTAGGGGDAGPSGDAAVGASANQGPTESESDFQP